jgi:hypothetical protein
MVSGSPKVTYGVAQLAMAGPRNWLLLDELLLSQARGLETHQTHI